MPTSPLAGKSPSSGLAHDSLSEPREEARGQPLRPRVGVGSKWEDIYRETCGVSSTQKGPNKC